MPMEKILFYGFSALLIFSAFMVITSRNSVRAVLFLVLAFVASSGLWLLAEAEFLSLILVLVYVGAVMVLFLFVVMMLNMNIAPIKEGFSRYLPLGLLIGILLIWQVIWVFLKGQTLAEAQQTLVRQSAEYSNTTVLGKALYTEYLYPFELAGVLLLVAIVAAIALTFRGIKNRKRQDPSVQVSVTKKDRLRIVKL